MRLTVVVPSAARSGAEIVLGRLVAAAKDRGWTVVALAPPGRAARALEVAGADWLPLPELTLPEGQRPYAAWKFGARSARAVSRVRRVARVSDVVLVNGLHALPAVVPATIGRPTIWWVHDVNVRPVRRAVGCILGRRVQKVVAVSDAAAAPLIDCGLAVTVVPNGVTIPVDVRSSRPSAPLLIGSVAALTPWKGHAVLLEAFASIVQREPSAVLELIGEPFEKDVAYAERLRKRASLPDLRGRVRFLGYCSAPLDHVRRWTVAVSASLEPEASGLATLEAMSVGVPVVATRLGATPAVLGDAGVLVEPGHPEELRDAMVSLIADRERWERCHRAGPARVSARFSTAAQMSRMLDVIEETAGVH